MNELEIRLAKVADTLLIKYGFPVTVENFGNGTFDTSTLKKSTTGSPSSGKAAFFDPSASNLNGYEKTLFSDTTKDRKWMYFKGDAPIKVGQIILKGSDKFKVISRTHLGSTDTVVSRIATEQI